MPRLPMLRVEEDKEQIWCGAIVAKVSERSKNRLRRDAVKGEKQSGGEFKFQQKWIPVVAKR